MSQIDYKIEETQFLKIYSRYSAEKNWWYDDKIINSTMQKNLVGIYSDTLISQLSNNSYL